MRRALVGRIASVCTITSLACVVLAGTASGRGFEDCGFRDFANGGWTFDPPAGVYLHLRASDMGCKLARKRYRQVRYDDRGRPYRGGYDCRTLEYGFEYAKARCDREGSKAYFVWDTGA